LVQIRREVAWRQGTLGGRWLGGREPWAGGGMDAAAAEDGLAAGNSG